MIDFNEVGVTNLGDIPDGVSFLDASRSAKGQRKFTINPDHHSKRLTVCETSREIWRIAESLPEPHRSNMQLLAGQAYDMGKRMDVRMKELKAALR